MRYDSLAKNEERICAKVIEMECHPSDPFLFFFFPPISFLPPLVSKRHDMNSLESFSRKHLPFPQKIFTIYLINLAMKIIYS